MRWRKLLGPRFGKGRGLEPQPGRKRRTRRGQPVAALVPPKPRGAAASGVAGLHSGAVCHRAATVRMRRKRKRQNRGEGEEGGRTAVACAGACTGGPARSAVQPQLVFGGAGGGQGRPNPGGGGGRRG